jgi:hypothetical protein
MLVSSSEGFEWDGLVAVILLIALALMIAFCLSSLEFGRGVEIFVESSPAISTISESWFVG